MTIPPVRLRFNPDTPRLRARVLPSIPPLQASFRNNGTHIQWRIGSAGEWTDLVALSDIVGPIASIVPGDGIDVDTTDPVNPTVSLLASSDGRDLINAPDYAAMRALLSTAPYVASLAALKALDTTKDAFAVLDGVLWAWTTGDFSAVETADTGDVFYAKADAIATTVGVWVKAASKGLRVYSMLDFGATKAMIDGTASCHSVMNALFAQVRADVIADKNNFPLHLGAVPRVVDLTGGKWMTTTSINATGISPDGSWVIDGGIILGKCAGKIVFDLTDSQRAHINDLRIVGDRTDMPAIGIFLGHTASGFAGGMRFGKVTTAGWFTRAGFANYGGESGQYDNCLFENWNGDGYAAQLVGNDNSGAFSSDYLTVTTGAVSFIHNLYNNCTFSYLGNGAAVTPSSITKANPAVVTSAGHPFQNGDTVVAAFLGGMTQLNDSSYTVANRTANTFELAGVNSGSYGTYTSGGVFVKAQTKPTLYLSRLNGQNFVNCYVVNYGTDAIEISLNSNEANNEYDFLIEGAAIRSAYRFTLGAAAYTLSNTKFKTHGCYAKTSFFSTDASGVGIAMFAPEIKIGSTVSVLTLPLLDTPSKFQMYGADIYCPQSGSISPAAMLAFHGRTTHSDTGLTTISGEVGALFGVAEAVKTSDYTVAVTDAGKPLVANKATAITFNLPAVASAGIVPYVVKNINDGALTLDPNSTETIDGATTLVLNKNDAAIVWPNGTAWRGVVARSALPPVASKTGAYTVIATDNQSLILCSASGGAFTVGLTAAATLGAGFEVTVKKTDSSALAVTVDPNGSETIDGASTFVLNEQYEEVRLRSNGTNWEVIAYYAPRAQNTREVLTAARTVYVRTDGSDSNTGLANTSGGAKLTLQGAWDAISMLDASIYAITIEVGAGTFTGRLQIDKAPLGGSGITINGAGASSTTIQTTTNNHRVIKASVPVVLTLTNFKLTSSSGANADLIHIDTPGAKVFLGAGMEFGASAGAFVRVINNGYFGISANFAISAANGSGGAFWTQYGGIIEGYAYTVTITNTPAWVGGFVVAEHGSNQIWFGYTFSGSATGVRYSVIANATVNTFGGGASYFPGGTGGSTATGGQYV